MPPRIAKLAGLGAFGAIGFFVLIFALILYAALPKPQSGIDGTHAAVAWISLIVVLLGLVGVHVVLGRQLLYLGKGAGARGL